MANLVFRYGVMGSAKTLNLLVFRFNLINQGHSVALFKPSLDTRDLKVSCRIPGLSADITDDYLESIYQDSIKGKYQVVLVDEAQFLQLPELERLVDLANNYDVKVFCYGLKTDFQTSLFEGSAYLLANADVIEEIETWCSNKKCTNKAIYNMRIKNGLRVTQGPVIQIGGDESYKGVCKKCFWETPPVNLSLD